MHLLLRPRSATPLLLGTHRPPLSIDISYPRGAWQQTRRTQELPSIDGTDRQTYGQTDGHQTVTETLLSILFEQRQIAHLSIKKTVVTPASTPLSNTKPIALGDH